MGYEIKVQCTCGDWMNVPITSSDAAKAMRANRKTELTSDQARKIQKKRKNWPNKKNV